MSGDCRPSTSVGDNGDDENPNVEPTPIALVDDHHDAAASFRRDEEREFHRAGGPTRER